ncbi:tyrosine-type recombinase/integrase [Plantibacter sp. RU18]|uniref:tyrosine-type recombinase/integrase n=1 Tax=Plantibacter sp. RU18 TaxID=3158143 RepID=UPI003D35EDBD
MNHETPDLQSVLAYWRVWQESQGLSERTIQERADVVTRLMEHANVEPLALTPMAIMTFVARKTLSTNTRGTYHASIRAYCSWLVKTDQRVDDPSTKTPTPKRVKGKPRPVFSNQLLLMLAIVNRRRTRTMILLAALAGMRVHEIAKIHGSHIDRANGVLRITGKGGLTQMVPLHDELVAEALSYPENDFWFPAYAAQTSSEHVTRQGVYAAIKGVMDRAGVEGTPHQLRHWYGTSLLDCGVDVRVVQRLMRHQSLDTTAIYTEVSLRKEREGINMLELPRAA